MLHFCTACTLLVCARPTRQKESARGACFAFLACCFFFFPCVLLKAPQQNRAKAPQQNRAKAPQPCESTPTKSRKGPNQVPKGPQPSPERAPTKSRKGPRPCESTPDSDLNQAKLCPIWPSVLLVFLNSQCRASFRPLPSQHAMPFWCQQNESTHHFLKSLTFRRPTLLFRDLDFVTVNIGKRINK
jgi:hypothetical protein